MNLSQFWTEILQSNTFNFTILVIIFFIIIKVCKISSLINSGIDKVKETIDKSTLAKTSSIDELKQAEEKVLNVRNEVKEIENKNNIAILNNKEKIQKETEKQIESIKENAFKILDAKEREIISHLSKKTIIVSIELAKEHIKNLLEKNPQYHEQFINESIKELNRLNQ